MGLVALRAKNLLLLSDLTVGTNVFLCLPCCFVPVQPEEILSTFTLCCF